MVNPTVIGRRRTPVLRSSLECVYEKESNFEEGSFFFSHSSQNCERASVTHLHHQSQVAFKSLTDHIACNVETVVIIVVIAIVAIVNYCNFSTCLLAEKTIVRNGCAVHVEISIHQQGGSE